MRLRRILALALALALCAAMEGGALASGLIGSVSGVSEGVNIGSANLGQEAYRQAEEQQSMGGTAPGATIDLGIGENTTSPQAASDAQEDYQLSDAERALKASLEDTVPVEGWHAQFVGENTLVMITMPELIVWDVEPERGVMELRWYRQVADILGEGASTPMIELSPDGNYALMMPLDGSLYLLSEDTTLQVAPPDTAPDRLIWAGDSQSYAYVSEGMIHVFTLDGRSMLISGEVTTPIASELEWLNPAPTPAALEALLSDENWTLAGMNRNCALFESADGAHSCAYIYATGEVVDYPQAIHSSDNIGQNGACPILDEASQRYRLYMDGAYSDIPILELIASGTTNNMYGWLGDSICVLEQDAGSRSSFRLHAANTTTGITYTLLTPWEYSELLSAAQPTAAPVSGIISAMQSGEAGDESDEASEG